MRSIPTRVGGGRGGEKAKEEVSIPVKGRRGRTTSPDRNSRKEGGGGPSLTCGVWFGKRKGGAVASTDGTPLEERKNKEEDKYRYSTRRKEEKRSACKSRPKKNRNLDFFP